MTPTAASPAAQAAPPHGLSRAQLHELYYYMRLTRSLEERLVNLYRQTKVIGGLFRSLGQEADSVGSAYALDRTRGDFLSPLIRNLGSMLVQGAQPLEILRQYMAKAESPTRGRELNIHYGDLERGFIGQISHLGDMVPVMAGVALSFKMRKQPRVGMVYVGDGAMSTGAFHEGINFAAVQRLPMVIICENNGYSFSTPMHKQTAVKQLVDKAASVRHSRGARRRQRRARGVRRHQAGGGAGAPGRRLHPDRAGHLPPEGARGARQPVLRACGGARGVGGEGPDRPLRPRLHRGGVGHRRRTGRRSTPASSRCWTRRSGQREDEPMPDAMGALDGVLADPARAELEWYRRTDG